MLAGPPGPRAGGGAFVRTGRAAWQAVLSGVESVGRFFTFLGLTCLWAVRPPYDVREWLRQMSRLGVASLPVVVLTGAFTGMVMTLQIFQGFSKFRAEAFVGAVVSLSVLREISPILTALLVTGRAGSSVAAEIGNMRATEQVDALVTMSTDPVQYLFVPRVLAGVVTLPLLTLVSDGVAIAGGRLVAVHLLGANPRQYTLSTFRNLELLDLTSGLIKAAVFGLIFSLIACVEGYHATGGSEGVGRASTRAVVSASVSVVVSDFFLSRLMF